MMNNIAEAWPACAVRVACSLTARSLCPDTILPRVEALRFSHSWPVSSASSTYMPNTNDNRQRRKIQAVDVSS